MSAIQKHICIHCGRMCRSGAGLASHDRAFHWFENGCPLCDGGGGPACSWHFL